MKRLFIAFMLLMAGTLATWAQSGLKINQIFTGDYATDPDVTMTIMSGDNRYLVSHHLTVLATFKGPAEKYAKTVASLVVADGAKAVGRNVRYKDGELYYAFYALPKLKSGKNELSRYIYYISSGSPKHKRVTLVYFEGKITQGEATRLIRTFKR